MGVAKSGLRRRDGRRGILHTIRQQEHGFARIASAGDKYLRFLQPVPDARVATGRHTGQCRRERRRCARHAGQAELACGIAQSERTLVSSGCSTSAISNWAMASTCRPWDDSFKPDW